MEKLKEINAKEYKENMERAVKLKNVKLMLVFVGLSLVIIIFFLSVVLPDKLPMVILFYGIVFVTGFAAFSYLCISSLRRVQNKQIDHVYIGEAVIVDDAKSIIEYIDVEGEKQIVHCPLLEKYDSVNNAKIQIVMEDDEVVKVEEIKSKRR